MSVKRQYRQVKNLLESYPYNKEELSNFKHYSKLNQYDRDRATVIATSLSPRESISGVRKSVPSIKPHLKLVHGEI